MLLTDVFYDLTIKAMQKCACEDIVSRCCREHRVAAACVAVMHSGCLEGHGEAEEMSRSSPS